MPGITIKKFKSFNETFTIQANLFYKMPGRGLPRGTTAFKNHFRNKISGFNVLGFKKRNRQKGNLFQFRNIVSGSLHENGLRNSCKGHFPNTGI